MVINIYRENESVSMGVDPKKNVHAIFKDIFKNNCFIIKSHKIVSSLTKPVNNLKDIIEENSASSEGEKSVSKALSLGTLYSEEEISGDNTSSNIGKKNFQNEQIRELTGLDVIENKKVITESKRIQ